MAESIETVVAELANAFANLTAREIDDYWEAALKRMKALGFDRSILWKQDEKGIVSAFCWARDDLQRPLGIYLNERLPYVMSQFENPNSINVINVLEIPETATTDNLYIHEYGLKHMVCVPIVANNSIIARLTIGTYDSRKEICPRMFSSLKLFSAIYAHALQKQRLENLLAEHEATARKTLAMPSGLAGSAMGARFALKGKKLESIVAQARKVAATDTTVLICGETGTGKELVAQFIHNASKRGSNRMYAVNCATFGPELLESQLFGHEKGAFTGAAGRRVGLFEIASESTIFFDEIGEMPVVAQAKMLRVLQEKQFERLGSSKPLRTNARIIAATNRNLADEARRGTFRDDLFYRINVFPLFLPPLRERRDEIPLLIHIFIQEFNASMGKNVENIRSSDMAVLMRHDWPGNIRELRNMVERAMALLSG